MATKTKHHHGNLKEALVEAGLAILSEEGFDGLTLRKAAQRAGVSHAAPAHHFDGKQGLLAAIAARGYKIFSGLMRDERFRRGSDPRSQLLGISSGYLRFAREHPALFRLVFTTEFDDHSDEILQEAGSESYMILSEVCGLFEPSRHGPSVNEMQVWSAVHGYALLSAHGRHFDPLSGKPIELEAILPELTPRTP